MTTTTGNAVTTRPFPNQRALLAVGIHGDSLILGLDGDAIADAFTLEPEAHRFKPVAQVFPGHPTDPGLWVWTGTVYTHASDTSFTCTIGQGGWARANAYEVAEMVGQVD